MKFVAILSLAIVAAADGTGCTAYVCDPSGVTWGDNVCAMLDAKNSTLVDLKTGECSSDQSCPALTVGLALTSVTCATGVDPQPGPAAYPGERCDRLRQCIGTGVTCTDGICSVPTGTCAYPQDCGAGKYCNTAVAPAVCANQVAVGGTCVLDTDCVNNAGCDTIQGPGNTGKCVQYASVAAGTAVQSCVGTTTTLASHYLCASGYCYESSAGKYACAGAVANSASLPNRCGTMPSTCKSATDATSTLALTSSCECGLDGYPYCPLFANDPDMVTFMSDMQAFLGSSSLSNCNTIRHGIAMSAFQENQFFWCGLNLTDTQAYHAARASMYPQVIMALDCVVKVVAPGYYKLEGSESLLIGGLFLALLQ